MKSDRTIIAPDPAISIRFAGFTLAEVMVAVVLISILAMAVGLAMNHSYARTNESRNTISKLRSRNDCISDMAEDFRWATSVAAITATSISCLVPDIAGGTSTESVSYYWDSDSKNLYCQRDGGIAEVAGDGIYSFELSTDVLAQGDSNFLRGVTVAIQFGTTSDGAFGYFIEMVNMPLLP